MPRSQMFFLLTAMIDGQTDCFTLAHACGVVNQGLFQGGARGGGFCPPGNLVAPPRNLFVGP